MHDAEHQDVVGVTCGNDGTYHHTRCQAAERDTRPSDRFKLDAYANRYRSDFLPNFQSFDGCDSVNKFTSEHAQCLLNVTSDRTVTVTWSSG